MRRFAVHQLHVFQLRQLLAVAFLPSGAFLPQVLADGAVARHGFQHRKVFISVTVTACQLLEVACLHVDPPEVARFDSNFSPGAKFMNDFFEQTIQQTIDDLFLH